MEAPLLSSVSVADDGFRTRKSNGGKAQPSSTGCSVKTIFFTLTTLLVLTFAAMYYLSGHSKDLNVCYGFSLSNEQHKLRIDHFLELDASKYADGRRNVVFRNETSRSTLELEIDEYTLIVDAGCSRECVSCDCNSVDTMLGTLYVQEVGRCCHS